MAIVRATLVFFSQWGTRESGRGLPPPLVSQAGREGREERFLPTGFPDDFPLVPQTKVRAFRVAISRALSARDFKFSFLFIVIDLYFCF